MANSGSVLFPFEEDLQNRSLKRATTLVDVFNSAIKCFILTDPMSRLGNPVGSSIPQLIHQLLSDEDIASVQDEIKNELAEQFPEIEFLDISLESIDKVSWKILVKYTTPFIDIIDLELLLQN